VKERLRWNLSKTFELTEDEVGVMAICVRFAAATSLSLSLCLSLSVLTAIFPGGPGLAGTRMSPFWTVLELRMMEVVSGDNWSYKKRAKLQSNHHHQQTNTKLFTGQMPFCRPTNSVRALKGTVHVR